MTQKPRPNNQPNQWKAWKEERARYKERQTEGFQRDIEELSAHIITLEELAPKLHPDVSITDSLAARVLEKLKADLAAGRAYFEANSHK